MGRGPSARTTLIGQPVNMLGQQQPDHEAGLDPRPPVLAVERCDLAVDPVPIDLADEQNQHVLQIDDWSSRARSRSPDPVVLCFLGRIVPSDTSRESRFALRGNHETEFARFRCTKHQNPAISNQHSSRIMIPDQTVSPCSRTTNHRSCGPAGRDASAASADCDPATRRSTKRCCLLPSVPGSGLAWPPRPFSDRLPRKSARSSSQSPRLSGLPPHPYRRLLGVLHRSRSTIAVF